MTAVGGVHMGLASSFEELVATNARIGGFSHGNVYPSRAEGARVASEAERLGNVTIDAAVARHGDRALLTELGGATTAVAEKSGRLDVMASRRSTFANWRGAFDGPVDAVRSALGAQPGTARPVRGAAELIQGFGASIQDVSRANGLLHAYSNRSIYPTAGMGETSEALARRMSDLAVDLTLVDPNAAGTSRRLMDGARTLADSAGRMDLMASNRSTFSSWSGLYDDALSALQEGLHVATKLR